MANNNPGTALPDCKVLIADDEAIIREGIRESVRWSELGMRVVAEAEDGEEALELALRHGVQIVLVDLNMPILDGIGLMEKLREQLPACKIIIITGHDEFAYAQKAIRLQVKDYILKPANPAQLERVLRQVRGELEQEADRQQQLETASRQFSRNYPLLRERFCQEWMGGHMDADEIAEHLEFLNLPVLPPALLGVIRLREAILPQPALKEQERQLYLYAVENIAAELLTPYPKAIYRDPFGFVVILLWDASAPAEAAFRRIEPAARTFLKIAVDLEVMEGGGDLTEIPAIYRKCKSAVLKEAPLSPLVRRAKYYIHDHYADRGLTLERIAAELHTSPVYLSRLIKQELGVSFNGYLTRLRMRKAIQLLHATELAIHEIAERVGYETQHYFSTAFKRTTGVSPLQFRKGEKS
ncbi:response regulator [Paenibacillus sanfengchensis]|uniref:response regulator n=1 Tax=Paenibacillus sanfengchensis TaxID=3119819 RepID=UPI002FE375FD